MNEDQDESAVFLGSSASSKTMADGTLRVTIDLSPGDAVGAFTAFGAPGSPVAIARMSNEVALEAGRPKDVKPFGQEAQALFRSSFFRNPEVWKAIGTDEDYLLWVKQQPSAISGDFDYYENTGDKWCVAAHVRRVEHGSGTAIKPPYSAIPLTNKEHQKSHQHGDTYLGTEEWWDKKRIKYVHEWCWLTAKDQIQSENPDQDYDSFGKIPPLITITWARKRNIEGYLPNLYVKGCMRGETEEHQEASET